MTLRWPAVASHVDQVPFRRLFRPLKRPVLPGSEIVTAYTDGVVTARSNRRIEGYHEASNLTSYQGVRAGDFVVHGLDILRGSVGVSESDGAMSPVVTVCEPIGAVEPRFVGYAIFAQAQSGYTKALARGVREGGADFRRWDTLAELPLPAPSVGAQRAIADFLDTETARIDALITKKEAQRGLLAARWAALLDEQMCHGDQRRIKTLTDVITSGPRGWSEFTGDVGEPFIRAGNLTSTSTEIAGAIIAVDPPRGAESKRSRIQQGDVLVGITGANTAWVGRATDQHAGGYVSQHVAIVRPAQTDPAWLAYALAAPATRSQLLGGQYGGTKTQLGLSDLAELTVFAPGIDEQNVAAQLLHSNYQATQNVTGALERQIELLRERRQALITAAVTGQMDVPGVAA